MILVRGVLRHVLFVKLEDWQFYIELKLFVKQKALIEFKLEHFLHRSEDKRQSTNGAFSKIYVRTFYTCEV